MAQQIVKLYAAASAYVDQSSPITNFCSGSSVYAQGRWSGRYPGYIDSNNKYVYLKFQDMAESLKKKRIDSYRLYAYINSITSYHTGSVNGTALPESGQLNTGGYYTHDAVVFYTNQTWAENSITWDTKPTVWILETLQAASLSQNQYVLFYTSNSEFKEDIIKSGIGIYTQSGACGTYSNVDYDVQTAIDIASSRNSINRPYLELTLSDVIPYAASCTPASGFINEGSANTFSWKFAYNSYNVRGILKQNGAKFRWRTAGAGSYTETAVAGETASITIPAGTFPNGEIEWQVVVTSDDGIEAAPSSWYKLTTVDKPSTVKNISPNGQYLDGAQPIVLKWQHVSEVNSAQTGYEIQVYQNSTWTKLAEAAGSDQVYIVLPHTLSAGKITWKVRTKNTDGVYGAYSEEAQIYVIEAPQTPGIRSVTGGTPRPTVEWISTGQAAFRIMVFKDSAVIYDSRVIAGADRSFKIPMYLKDGQYTIKMAVQNEFSLWSSWCEYKHSVETAKPVKPSLAVQSAEGGVRLVISNVDAEVTKLYILRNGVCIMKLASQREWTDYSFVGEASYVVRAVNSADCFCDSNEVKAATAIKGSVIAGTQNLSDQVKLFFRRNEKPKRDNNLSVVGNAQYFAGRTLPTFEFSEFLEKSHNFAFSYTNRTDFEKLKALIESRSTILYKDSCGRRFYGVITGIASTDERANSDFSLSILEVDFIDEISYE